MYKLNKSKIKWTIIFSMPLLITCTIVLLGYYPGVMLADSFSQWSQARSLTFQDWHPVIHTWFTMFITNFWYSPAAVAIVQIVLLSFVIGYALSLFKEYGVSKNKLIILSFVIAILPEIPLMSICMFKDIMYCFFITFLSVLMIRIYFEGGKLLLNKGFCIALFIADLGTVFFRHNGIIPGIITLILLAILLKNYRKQVLIILGIVVLIFVIISGPVYKALNVEPTSKSESMGVLVNAIGRTVKYKGNLINDSDKQKLSEILPFDKWGQDYATNATDYIKFDKDFKKQKINEDVPGFIKLWFNVFKVAPKETIKSYLYLTNIIWNPVSGVNNTTIVYPMDGNDLGIKSNPILGDTSKLIVSTYSKVVRGRSIIWKPAIPMYLFLILTVFCFIKYRNKKMLLIMSPLVFNVLSLAICIPAQDYRYLFANHTIFLVTLPIIFMKEINKKGLENE